MILREKKRKQKRIFMSLIGVILSGISVGIILKSNFGADPFTCFVMAFVNMIHLTYQSAYVIVTGVLFAFVFFVDRHYIGIGTIFNLFVVGAIAEGCLNILDQLFVVPTLIIRILLLTMGILIGCFAGSLYITANLGVSAYDAVALILNKKFHIASYRTCRICSDIVCVATGWFCSVTIGAGTVISACMMGPIIQWFNTHISEIILYGKEEIVLK